jgi:PAS domain S-box-containing protein
VLALHADGHEFPIEASISQFIEPTPDGPRPLFTVMLRDITARREAEAALRQMKERYRTTIDLCPNAICIVEAGRISLTNRALRDLLGARSDEELLGRRFGELFACDPRHEARTAEAGGAVTHEVQILRLDGEERDVEMLQADLPDHGATTVQIVLHDVTERKETARLLEQSREQLKRLSRNLIRARERERQHIARELHDELGQYLTAIKIEVAAIAGPPTGRRDADRRAAELLDLIDQTVASVRRIAADLRPPMLDDLGLEAAVEWLAKDWARRAGIDVALDVQPLKEEIDDNARTTVYRFVQEALTNVSRHARANRVYIRMRNHGTEVLVNVSDDGQGFPADVLAKPGTYGLLGMRERASLAGGTLWLGQADEGGASVEIRLPFDAASTAPPTAAPEA